MEERITLFPAHLRVGITKNEPNGSKEVAFTRSVAANYDIMLW